MSRQKKNGGATSATTPFETRTSIPAKLASYLTFTSLSYSCTTHLVVWRAPIRFKPQDHTIFSACGWWIQDRISCFTVFVPIFSFLLFKLKFKQTYIKSFGKRKQPINLHSDLFSLYHNYKINTSGVIK